VNIQVEFNPTTADAYRLIGYESQPARNEYLNDQTNPGEMRAGQTVTALFEVIPARSDRLKDQTSQILTLRIRYRNVDGEQNRLIEVPLVDSGKSFNAASTDYRFAASVAAFGMILRDSPHKGAVSLDSVIEMAQASRGQDRNGDRQEFITLVQKVRALR
jgi:Ca-activated chloride channel family protein